MHGRQITNLHISDILCVKSVKRLVSLLAYGKNEENLPSKLGRCDQPLAVGDVLQDDVGDARGRVGGRNDQNLQESLWGNSSRQ